MVYRLYLSSEIFFPLIADVLLDEQDGVVYTDDPAHPTQAYVEHAFGFAQIFGKCVSDFERDLERYLLLDRCFSPQKVRLYAPYLPDFLTAPEHQAMRSYRQRFVIKPEGFSRESHIERELEKSVSLHDVHEDNVSLIDETFGVVTRFWRNSTDFVRKSNATVVYYNGNPASICYAAAEADRRAEIDVLTLPEHRKLGLARLAVIEFVSRCFRTSLVPLWDCFTNNIGSMSLCKSVGFSAATAPYPFYTINRQRD